MFSEQMSFIQAFLKPWKQLKRLVGKMPLDKQLAQEGII
jgi:hypothetical protein